MKKLFCFVALLSLAVGCYVEKERKIDDRELGYSVVFPEDILVYPGTDREVQHHPEEWKPTRRKEQTPFGEIIWFSRTYTSKKATEINQIYIVDVGTIPPGDQGGTTQEEILATIKEWIGKTYPGATADLDYDHGPGFEYFHKKPTGSTTNGIVVFRRGRIHHARATAPSSKNKQMLKFLKSFQVDP